MAGRLSRKMAPVLRRELDAAPALYSIYDEIERPLVPVLLGLEEAGTRQRDPREGRRGVRVSRGPVGV